MTVGVLALVHGNETLGLPIVNTLIESLLRGEQVVDYDLYFGLGNIPAAFADKRFIDEDLNRCFGIQSSSPEGLRAQELQTLMLDHCDYLLDLHQTVSDAQKPFFIFQYASDRCLQIMESINPGIPTILQFDQIGMNTGLSTDEYLRSRGKFGTALELGKKGSTHYFGLGLSLCQNALDILVPFDQLKPIANVSFPTYRLDGRFIVGDAESKLHDGWENMKPFKKGDVLGQSKGGDILAPTEGLMLFPRYRTVDIGQELFFYCTPFSPMPKNEQIVLTPLSEPTNSFL